MTIIPQCFDCRHFRRAQAAAGDGYHCAAFPDAEIPTPILLNEPDHRRPYSGDGGIRFEPKPGSFTEVKP